MNAMNNIRIYQVGGSVRDTFMGVPSKDIDYAVEAPSYEAMRDYIVNERGGHIFVEHPEFVTIRAMIDRVAADFVLCRKDGAYSDGRRPDSVEVGTIYDDLARRDFTINAIAKAEDGTIIDPFDGITDIVVFNIIRCVGNAKARMQEDYLRLARAARFSITKDMMIDTNIESMFFNEDVLSEFCKSVSVDRIRQEVHKMFAHDTIKSIEFFGNHPAFARACFNNDIWLKPTTEM